MTEIQEKLFALRDEKYADFQAKLTPGIDKSLFIGVRMPLLRKFSKDFAKDPASREFLNSLPHTYYDENLVHAQVLSLIKDYDECIRLTEEFLPYIDNWAVCDTFSPKVFSKHKTELYDRIKYWIKSDRTYTIRFAIEMLMSHFLDEDYSVEYPALIATVRSDEYYVNMMIAWYFATALAKQWDTIIPFIENHSLDKWTHNKTIQKAIESYRITDEQKEYLRTLRLK